MNRSVEIEFTDGPRKGQRVFAEPTICGWSIKEPDGKSTLLAHGGSYRILSSRRIEVVLIA